MADASEWFSCAASDAPRSGRVESTARAFTSSTLGHEKPAMFNRSRSSVDEILGLSFEGPSEGTT